MNRKDVYTMTEMLDCLRKLKIANALVASTTGSGYSFEVEEFYFIGSTSDMKHYVKWIS
jgi:hypothetical protein